MVIAILWLFIVGLHVSRASCLLLTLYVRVLLLLQYYYTASGVRIYEVLGLAEMCVQY